MKVSRRGLLGAGLIGLAMPLLPRSGLAMELAFRPSPGLPGVGEVWGMGFWAADAGPLAAPVKQLAKRPLPVPSGWHPEFS